MSETNELKPGDPVWYKKAGAWHPGVVRGHRGNRVLVEHELGHAFTRRADMLRRNRVVPR